ncbi:Protein white [Phytophthora fragariae]|uniref:Protein white n=2 Tax=Phytophthora fragariae TaxID=53985 RepID=A0A6A3J953_9STRA|nr:Protein white [Phytophthora fragariae]KAE9089058.1 Protein white [Phytophthora fragariae]
MSSGVSTPLHVEQEALDHHFIQVETPKLLPIRGNRKLQSHEAPKFTLQWRNLNLKAAVENPQSKQLEDKFILSNVNGTARPGELLVIMGPSGAGKSSLLDCISGRNSAVEGDIVLNGQPWSDATKRLASYVMQDDLFYETITVKEHLVFQAKLRMGKTFTEQQYMKRVDEVMEELGLMKCRDTLIGGVSLRGISGGERKRLSFATEILTNPSILFVDEPTSGLDSFMAETVTMQLQQIARDGRTVIATIHQPSSELFALFDQLYLLSDGAAVYHGKASESVDYFASLGYPCPALMNPTDYFMRQLVVMDKATDEAGVARVEGLKQEWLKHQSLPQIEHEDFHGDGRASECHFEDSRLEWLGQIAVLVQRNVIRFVRDKFAFHAAIFQTLFISLVVGLIFLQLHLNQGGIQNFTGGFFFLVVNQTFASANPVFISVPMELPIIIREYKGGLYHLFSWYFSKNVSEFPMQVLLPIVFFVPVYFLMGIGHGFDVYVYQQIVMILVNSCAVGLGYMVSCLSRRVDIAPIIGVVIILPFLLFGGLLINSDDCPDYFIWVQYVSPIKYGFEALMKIFWRQVPSISCDAAIENCTALTGDDVLKNYSMESRSVIADGAILVAINLTFRVVGFLGLWLNLRRQK